jgi:GMP synthase-like glutamine amidotransferase
MRILVFQHTKGENPGAFLDHIADHGDSAQIVHLYDGQDIPALERFDLLLVMGGPMDVWETVSNPWLTPEKRAIERWVRELGRPYLGICLGHQLLIDALGGRCAPMEVPEIGVLPVELTDSAHTDPVFSNLPHHFPVVQWHGVAASDLPDGCEVLAHSSGCAVQAVRVLDKAWGVQFHPEVIQGTIEAWMGDPENHQCAVEWLGTVEAVQHMIRQSNEIAADQFRMTAEIYSALRKL